VYFVLIFNPSAGRNRHRRAAQIRQVALGLTALGHRIEVVETTAPGSATKQAQDAARGKPDAIFACGGDGTIHEVLQALVSETGEPSTVMGIIPLGSANALAHHLGIALNPLTAALQGINVRPQTIPVGKVTYGDQVRYFTVVAGAGPDGALVYDVLAPQKSNLGRLAYSLHAVRLFATRRFPSFEIEYSNAETGRTSTQQAVSAMAARIANLGGIFSRLAGRGTSLHDGYLRLVLLRPPAALALPLWFATGWLGLQRLNPYLSHVNATTFSCRPLSGPGSYFEADGEWLGRIPMQVSLVPNALRLLVPEREKGRGI
jgi:YegS/Rv2252/BmrU family lipid kinase